MLVELRDAPSAATAVSSTAIARQAAFIKSDGSIVSLDGISNLSFNEVILKELFIVLLQRNHLGIMTANTPVQIGTVYPFDFSTGPGQVYGGNLGYKELATGIWGMAGADGNADKQINNTDKNDIWAPQAGLSGYIKGDFNMDGQVNNTDKNDIWNPNTGIGGQVPD